jgi:hypothetical protein
MAAFSSAMRCYDQEIAVEINAAHSWTRGKMSTILKVRVKLTGCKLHEQPVSLAPSDRLPHIGEYIEIPLGDRLVRACVTSTTPPMCRSNDSITYVVYASEATEAAVLSPSQADQEQVVRFPQARSIA